MGTDEQLELLGGQISVMEKMKRDLEEVRSEYVKLKASNYPYAE